MKVEVEVPQEVIDQAADQRLKELLNPAGERQLLIEPAIRRQLEAVFETTIDDGAKLVRLVRNLCSYKIAHVEFSFTPDELARISMQATFHGRTRDTFIEEMVVEIKSRMLEQV